MEIHAGNLDYKDRTFVLVAIGALLLLVGIAAAILGPVEMYCFYLFSEGGRFHYEGFGFGSFMFGNIACQIGGYYLIAAVAIPLGYGHLKVRRWARKLSLTLLWFWLVVGLPLIVVLFLMLVTAKELSVAAVVIVAIALVLSYLALPGLLIRFYRCRNVRLTFEVHDPKTYWIEELPLPALVLSSLYIFYIFALHIPILFNGIVPFFGTFLYDLQGIALLDLLIACLVCLVWGSLRLKAWAWWGSLIYFGMATVSSILTLAQSSYADILSLMKFAPTEMDALQGVPAQGVHFAVLIGIPLLTTWGMIVLSKRHFGPEGGIS
ncbi:MAG: hypothetical protein DRI81_12735 [Chloroflexi bacterium]|nr:MAG: hypothetical protein DRI81_12735 [Chloroflexota bacterium]